MSVFGLYASNGLLNTFLPIRAEIEGFGRFEIGLMGTGYFGGFVIGCLVTPWLVKRVGHTRSFAALAGLAAADILLFASFVSAPFWVLFRLVFGACAAGMFMLVESWLNEKAPRESRGNVLAVYIMVYVVAVVVAQQSLTFAAPEDMVLFHVAAILMCVALVPLVLSTAPSPAPMTSSRLRPSRLYRVSPVAFAGCLGVGLANGAFWSMGPMFAQANGLSAAQVGWFVSAAILGNALLQWPMGRWSDHIDRRIPIAACLVGALAAGITLSLVSGVVAILVLAAVYGAFAMSIYALLIAQAGDRAQPEDFVEVSGGLILTFALGAVVGPIPAAWLMEIAGVGALFWWTAAMHGAAAIFVVGRIISRGRAPAQIREDFVNVPRTSPEVFLLDPRSGAIGKSPAEEEDANATLDTAGHGSEIGEPPLEPRPAAATDVGT